MLSGLVDPPEALVVDSGLDLVVATSRRGGTVAYSLLKGRFLRRLSQLTGDLLALGSLGHFLAWNSDRKVLRCASVNGDLLAAVWLSSAEPHISAMVTSSDGALTTT